MPPLWGLLQLWGWRLLPEPPEASQISSTPTPELWLLRQWVASTLGTLDAALGAPAAALGAAAELGHEDQLKSNTAGFKELMTCPA